MKGNKGMREKLKTEGIPAVSVIVPVYNPGEGFRRTISSLRNQTLENIELLFIDDLGDGSAMRMIREAAGEDPRIRILTNSVNSGPGFSRNRGIEAARGEYLFFMDSDDFVKENFLELLYRKAKQSGAQIVRGTIINIYEDGRECDYQIGVGALWRMEDGLKKGELLYRLFANGHMSALYRREWLAARNIRYGMTRNGEDTTFLLRACHQAESAVCEDEALYYYVQRRESLVHTLSAERLEQQAQAFRDQVDYMLANIPEPDPGYVNARISYQLVVHNLARMAGYGAEAEGFLTEIRRQFSRLPNADRIEERFSVVRCLSRYGVNLIGAPTELLEHEAAAGILLDTVRRNVAFACGHIEEKGLYKWLFRESLRNAHQYGQILKRENPALYRRCLLRLAGILLTDPESGRLLGSAAHRRLIGMGLTSIRVRAGKRFGKGYKRIHPVRGVLNYAKRMRRRLEERWRGGYAAFDQLPAAEREACEKPCVSVVLPVYEPGEGLEKCLAMLQNQTLEDIEMIFVDDRGQDDAMDRIREAAEKDRRIRILVNDENSGSGVSRNRGIEAARGEYVSFVDPDDYIAPDFLARLYAAAANDGADIAKGERRHVDMKGRLVPEGAGRSLNDTIRQGLARGKPLYRLYTYNHWTGIFRRSFLLESGARYGTTYNSQDTTFLLRACHAAQSIVFDDEAIYYYVSRETSRMRDFTRFRVDQELLSLKERLDYISAYIDEEGNAYEYILGQLFYCLRLQETVACQSPELGGYFLEQLRSMIRGLPFCNTLKRKNMVIRAMLWYGVNLITMPYRAQGRSQDVQARLRVIRSWTAFLTAHPSWQKHGCGSLRAAVRNMFLSEEMRSAPRSMRREARREAFRLIRQLPEPEALAKGSLSMTLFVRYGIAPFRLTAAIGRLIFDQN